MAWSITRTRTNENRSILLRKSDGLVVNGIFHVRGNYEGIGACPPQAGISICGEGVIIRPIKPAKQQGLPAGLLGGRVNTKTQIRR